MPRWVETAQWPAIVGLRINIANIIVTKSVFSARCNIYSVRLSVRLFVTEVHWRIIANLGFKFRSQFTAHCGRGACGREHWTIYKLSSVGAREGIIDGKSGGIISRYASHG